VTFGMTPALVDFVIVAPVGDAAEMASAFSGARKNRLDLSVGIALGGASQIALFVAPMLVLLSYVIGPTPMNLQFWPGAVVMMLVATMTASLLTNSGRSAWFVGVLVLTVYLIFDMTLYLLPPRLPSEGNMLRNTTENSNHRAYHASRSLDAAAPEINRSKHKPVSPLA
jgi:Ca2+:H+ antiporter